MRRRYLALGDSYTIGEGVTAAERWPTRLAALLRADGLDFAEPELVARTGWTTDELLRALGAREADREPFDLVSLLIGVNDQYRGYGAEDYARGFAALLERAVSFGGGPARVLVLSIPDWSVTPFARGRDRARIAAEIDAFNAVNRRLTAAAGAHYVDVTPASRDVGPAGELLVADGLHPGPTMHARWAELARPAARRALDQSGSL